MHGEFKQIAQVHLQGCGCPRCNSGSLNGGIISKGEILIEKLLNQFNIDFISQYEISINTNINPSGKAYIDFYLPQLNIAIEYNGEQHYIPKEFFGGEMRFNRQLLRDEYIRTYCRDNSIKLLEISYKSSKEEIENLIKSL